jgi:hypothetical protein
MLVYHFVSSEHGIENLQKRRLKIAELHSLNDPFELFGIEMSNANVRRAFEQMKNELAKEYGLLCFSKIWTNPVMWGHYADRHKGLCLGFEIPEMTTESENLIEKVSYTRKRLVANLEKLNTPDSLTIDDAKKFLYTKYSHWRYEKEIRAFAPLANKDPLTGFHFANFSDHLKLRSVIVGAESNLSRSKINIALGELAPDVETFKARLAFRTFKVVRQRNQKLWA